MKRAKKLLAGLLAASFVCSMTLGTAMAAQEVRVTFDGKDGEFQVSGDNSTPWNTNWFSEHIEVGGKFKDSGFVISDPVFWDSNRNFLGWEICKKDQTQHEYILIEDIATGSNAAVNYEIPNHDTYFVAKWEGDDSDYYSQVYINGYNTDLDLKIMEDDEMVNHKTQVWGNYLRESGENLGQQTQSYLEIVNDPQRSDATFEGWAEFEVIIDEDGHESFELVDNKLYTTGEILQKSIPSYDVAYVAKWSDIDLDQYFNFSGPGHNEVEVGFEGNGGEIPFSDGQITGTCGGFNRIFEIESTLKDNGVSVSDPIRGGDKFLGWQLCEFMYDQINDRPIFTPVTGYDLFTSEEALRFEIPDYHIRFLAQWEVNNTPYSMVSFDANDGSFEHVAGGMHMNSLYHGKEFPVGTTVADSGDTMNDPVFWDVNRKFEGWKLFEWGTALDNDGNEFDTLVPVQGVGLFTTAQAMNYVIPDYDIVFMAQYEGEHFDYYSRVDVQGYGAGFKFYEYRFEPDNRIEKVLIETDWWGNELKEDGTSLRDQACTQSPDRSYIEFYEEPKRPDATFEGWAEFKVEWTYTADDMIGDYTLVSDKLYTTNEMLDQVVRDYDVAYVAKWSDIKLEDYFNNSTGVPDGSESDDDDDEPQYSGNSGSTTAKPAAPSTTVTTDVKKGQVNSDTGIVTGEGAGYSKWIAESDAAGNTEWTFQYADGTMAAGTVKTNTDGTTYEQPAWEQINGSWYAFGADGKAEFGWLYDTDLAGWFYIDINRGMLTGWQLVDGKWYYMQTVSDGKKGIMYANTWIDGWYVDATGAWDGQPQKNN